MSNVFDRLLQSNTKETTIAQAQGQFIPSESFTGEKSGFAFKLGTFGLGYYLENNETTKQNSKKRSREERKELEKMAFESERKKIRELVDSAANKQVIDVVDKSTLRTIIVALEKKINENMLQRTKHADNPSAFMGSEIALDDHIKTAHSLATTPELYTELVRLQFVPSLLGLITHDNTDISVDTISLLNEMTDPEALDSDTSVDDKIIGINAFIDDLLKHKAFSLLVQNIGRLDEKSNNEAQGVHNTLNIFENLVELRPEFSTIICEQTDIFTYLLKRMDTQAFDPVKLYVSEILSILLQSSTKARTKFLNIPELDTLECLLQFVAKYKKKEPSSRSEREFVENIFDSICTCVMDEGGRNHFIELEGIELMVVLLKVGSPKYIAPSALKVIAYGTTNSVKSCQLFIEAGGLKYIFPYFMGKANRKKKQKEKGIAYEIEKSVLSTISNLFLHLKLGDTPFRRLVQKFLQDDCTKTERLIELRLQYVVQVDRHQTQGSNDEDVEYLERLDGGLETLQHIDIAIAQLLRAHKSTREMIMDKFYENNQDLKHVKGVILELYDHVEVDDVEAKQNHSAAEKLRNDLLNLAKVVEYFSQQRK